MNRHFPTPGAAHGTSHASVAPVPTLTRPSRLRPGDKVAVVATSSPVEREMLEAGLAVLRDWGLEVVVGDHVLDVHPELDYLAGRDEDRAGDLQAAWCDPDVAAVVCARGGYGAHRVTGLLDWSAMRAAGPKILLGYSDITVLHEAFASRLHLSTLHGPMPATEGFARDRAAQEHLRRTLFEPESVTTVSGPGAATLVPGRAQGVTLGGCASLLADNLGSPTSRHSAAGGILLLEDVGERAYRLDRCLSQLLNAGWLDGVAGIVLGSWQDSEPYERIRTVLLDRLGPLGVPMVEEMGFGHCPDPLTLGLGRSAVLDADAATLRYTSPVLE
ncbi:S66 peptidase family protein [Streptomyces spiramenti]|uniref:LD-carboxypeptidase n=1 Tax=Streptomyces spiramenti TaxID=2720606 RepID=A0ABX1AIA1_9ACTN|nr:LD-carboxypeptidase [Streptomyces spiramenti]NJP65391.1 LD-carboxypeptidase [Streptomyces spiramenti]